MYLSVKTDVEDIMKDVEGIRSRAIPYAISQAINDTLFDMRQKLSEEEASVFDKPVAFTTNLNAWEIDKATPAYAIGEIKAKPAQDAYLLWQVWGGERKAKKKAIGVPKEGGDVYAWHGGLTKGWKKVFENKQKYFSGTPKNQRWTDSAGRVKSGVWKRVVCDSPGGAVLPGARKPKKGSDQVRGLSLVLAWKPYVTYTKNPFDFEQVASQFANNNFEENFTKRLLQAAEYQKLKG